MKKLHSIIISILMVVIQTACSANDSIELIAEPILQSSSSSATTLESQKSSSSTSEPMTAAEETIETSEPPWDSDSPFGIAIENASVQLHQICQEYYCMYYTIGLADYNLDGIPELFLGNWGGKWGGDYRAFDVTEQEYRFLGSYSVGNLGQRLTVVADPYSDARYMKVNSESSSLFSASFVTAFFEPNERNLDIWEVHTNIQIDSRPGEEINESDKPSETYFHGHEYDSIEEEEHGMFEGLYQVEDPALIEPMKSRWFDKLWFHFPAPVVETEEQFPKPDPRLTDPEFTKELVYSLAKEYYEKFPEYVNESDDSHTQ